MKTIRFFGHSCFMISNDKERILIDPFLSGNPLAAAKIDDLKPTLILVTHGHGDHLGDAIEISKKSGAPIAGVFELVNYCSNKGAEVISGHMGGKFPFEFGWVKFVPAFHSSSTGDGVYTGNPIGFVINFYGHHIYHAGDTCIFGDMELIGRLYRVDTALLPIGGTYVMDIDDAVEAARMLNCSNVIPMHYNTFPPIEADPNVFREKVEAKTRAHGVILKPGEEMVID